MLFIFAGIALTFVCMSGFKFHDGDSVGGWKDLCLALFFWSIGLSGALLKEIK